MWTRVWVTGGFYCLILLDKFIQSVVFIISQSLLPYSIYLIGGKGMAQAVKILVRSALPSAVRNDGVQMHPVIFICLFLSTAISVTAI